MAHLAGGDESACRELVRRWQADLQRFLFRMLGDRDEAEDLTQETFIRLLDTADRYRPSGRFKSWVFRIAGNLARNEIRRRRIRAVLSLEALAESLFPRRDAATEMEGSVLREALHLAILRLPDRQRQALVMCRLEGFSHRETAEVMGTTEAAVEGLLSRASGSLRRRLGVPAGGSGEKQRRNMRG